MFTLKQFLSHIKEEQSYHVVIDHGHGVTMKVKAKSSTHAKQVARDQFTKSNPEAAAKNPFIFPPVLQGNDH